MAEQSVLQSIQLMPIPSASAAQSVPTAQPVPPVQIVNPLPPTPDTPSVQVLPGGSSMPPMHQGSGIPQGMQDIHDIEAPIQVGIDPFIIQMIIGGTLLVILILMGYLLFRYYQKKRMARELESMLQLPPPLPPDETAKKALAVAAFLKSTDPRRYYFRLTALLKTFIGKMFSINAPEMTTHELLVAMNPLLPKVPIHRELMISMKALFEAAAMIKYAAVMPSEDQMARHEALAGEFIEKIYEEMTRHETPQKEVS